MHKRCQTNARPISQLVQGPVSRGKKFAKLSLRADREPSPRFLAVPEMGNSTRKRDEKSALSSGKSLAPFAAVSLRSRRTFQVRNVSRAQIAPHYQSLLPKNVSQNIRGHKTSRAYDTFRSWKPPSQTTARLRLIAIIPCCGYSTALSSPPSGTVRNRLATSSDR
jgi:hypothetical protein